MIRNARTLIAQGLHHISLGALNLKMAALHFVNISKKVMNLMEENSISKSTNTATDFFIHTYRHICMYIYIYIYIYIYVIVGNCSKCCKKVLNTHGCRAKYRSKWLKWNTRLCFILVTLNYIYIYICMNRKSVFDFSVLQCSIRRIRARYILR